MGLGGGEEGTREKKRGNQNGRPAKCTGIAGKNAVNGRAFLLSETPGGQRAPGGLVKSGE